MNLTKHLPLTETTYYILLSLIAPLHGYAIMQNVEVLSGGKVKIAAGTLYGALENLSKQNLIFVAGEDGRRKIYSLTGTGREVLNLEYQRMLHLIKVTSDLLTADSADSAYGAYKRSDF